MVFKNHFTVFLVLATLSILLNNRHLYAASFAQDRDNSFRYSDEELLHMLDALPNDYKYVFNDDKYGQPEAKQSDSNPSAFQSTPSNPPEGVWRDVQENLDETSPEGTLVDIQKKAEQPSEQSPLLDNLLGVSLGFIAVEGVAFAVGNILKRIRVLIKFPFMS